MARTRYKFSANEQPHFLTCTTVNWIPLFTDESIAQILIDSLRFLQEHHRLKIFAYVIMEHHIHLIASSKNLGKEIGDFKSFSARKIIDYLEGQKAEKILRKLQHHKLRHKKDRTYQVWQEGSHPEQLQGTEMMWQKVEYIHQNPARKGYVDDPVRWKYSSAINYTGQPGMLEVTVTW